MQITSLFKIARELKRLGIKMDCILYFNSKIYFINYILNFQFLAYIIFIWIVDHLLILTSYSLKFTVLILNFGLQFNL